MSSGHAKNIKLAFFKRTFILWHIDVLFLLLQSVSRVPICENIIFKLILTAFESRVFFQGSSESQLKPKMKNLLTSFAFPNL